MWILDVKSRQQGESFVAIAEFAPEDEQPKMICGYGRTAGFAFADVLRTADDVVRRELDTLCDAFARLGDVPAILQAQADLESRRVLRDRLQRALKRASRGGGLEVAA